MDFSFADTFLDYLLDLIRYLIYGQNPFSVLFYASIMAVVILMCFRFLKGSL